MTVRVVSHRVDAVTLAYRVELDPDFVKYLAGRGELARKHGRAAIEWGPIAGELRYSRAAKTWLIVNPVVRVRVDVWGPGKVALEDGSHEPGWTVEVVWAASELARVDVDTVTRVTRKMVEAIAVGGAVHEARLRRLDLCADVAGWAISRADAARLVRRPHSKMTEYGRGADAGAEDGAATTPASVHSTRDITGVTVCPGGEVLLRIYDKREELKRQPEDKRAAEEERWTAGGWDGAADVTRVEYQIRGQALKELGIRDPDRPYDPQIGPGRLFRGLGDVVDRVWAWCLTWCRLALEDHERASRRSRDPVWEKLARVRFFRKLAPGEIHSRVRVRGGASHEQALGCALSILAAKGLLPKRDEDPIPRVTALRVVGVDAETALRAELGAVFRAVSDEVGAHFVAKHGPIGGLRHLAIVGNGTRARLSVAQATLRAIALSRMQPVRVRDSTAAGAAVA
jgi:hypothetical protein